MLSPSDRQKFIDWITPAAVDTAKRTGVPASFTIAQAAEETRFGTSVIALNALNLFDIKADVSWTGPCYSYPTTEIVDGKPVVVPALWRKYGSFEECFEDHAQFFHKNKRYHSAFACADGEGFARAVAAAGYATDPAYADKLIALIRQYDLLALDVPAPSPSKGQPVPTDTSTSSSVPSHVHTQTVTSMVIMAPLTHIIFGVLQTKFGLDPSYEPHVLTVVVGVSAFIAKWLWSKYGIDLDPDDLPSPKSA